jgi:hypothetical protein
VIAISGYQALRADALRRGAQAFLVKPFSPDDLLNALEAALRHEAVSPSLLAENARAAEDARNLAEVEAARTVASLASDDVEVVRDDLRRAVRWLTTYFGFGTGTVCLLHGSDLCVEAMYAGQLGVREGEKVPRMDLYCGEAIAAGSTLVLADPAHHPSDHIALHKQVGAGWRFYAGVPLRMKEHAVGTVCILDTKPHGFSVEDMRVLEAIGRGVSLAIEKHGPPVDRTGTLASEYLDLFIETAAARAAREGGEAVGLTIEPGTGVPAASGLAAVRLDDRRVILLWGGHTGGWSPPETVKGHVLATIALCDVHDCNAAAARIRSLLN